MADIEHIPWSAVWDKPVLEFLNMLAFIRDYNKEQERQMEQWRLTH